MSHILSDCFGRSTKFNQHRTLSLLQYVLFAFLSVHVCGSYSRWVELSHQSIGQFGCSFLFQHIFPMFLSRTLIGFLPFGGLIDELALPTHHFLRFMINFLYPIVARLYTSTSQEFKFSPPLPDIRYTQYELVTTIFPNYPITPKLCHYPGFLSGKCNRSFCLGSQENEFSLYMYWRQFVASVEPTNGRPRILFLFHSLLLTLCRLNMKETNFARIYRLCSE